MSSASNSGPLAAATPRLNATVHASAGTGKTWLLVTRLVRLLLAGARPNGILAITFTRKAAAEMQERLGDRLRELLEADDRQRAERFAMMGIPEDPDTITRARQLYEELLFAEQPLRTTTFHAFCQELLQRFPLEAGVPPGFELVEATGLLEQEAWDALFAEATGTPDSPLATALESLFALCGGLHNTRELLLTFLHHRSDWWAFTKEGSSIEQALVTLAGQLQINPDQAPLQGFPSDTLRTELLEFAELLGRHPTAAHTGQQATIHTVLSGDAAAEDAVQQLRTAFFTTSGSPRKRKSTKTQQGKMGADGEARFLELDGELVSALEAATDQLNRYRTWRTTAAWYHTGSRFLEHYQRIKQEQRMLDFADLEWRAYRLLQHSENAHWVQFKLDQRIDHLLVDEFQDTNPTQWRLLLPLLEELSAGETERERSVFLVGDAKQSIYRFRRGDPRLLDEAAHWLRQNLAASPFHLDASRRSAQAIIDCVNRVFDLPQLAGRITGFQAHSTFNTDLWGRVEMLPLVGDEANAEEESAAAGLRNPLQQPRRIHRDLRHYREGQLIAARIRELIDKHTPVGAGGSARPMRYGDIMILVRRRSHVQAYEQALREADIPFLSAGRGTLLDSLEVRDLEALLNSLIAPMDNLALAQVLRSPLFSASDDDLVLLAGIQGGNWHERLGELAAQLPAHHALHRAHHLLCSWRTVAGAIPIHDLLDRIFFEADVVARYRAAFPPALQARVNANLTRFLELALEVDSGRYPSLPHFLNRLRQLRAMESDAPDEAAPDEGGGDRVRIMTIHGSKGLEAPAVFLADSVVSSRGKQAYQALIDWPSDADRPAYFLLTGRRQDRDAVSRDWVAQQDDAEEREDANLLYVALTRPRQLLFLSGCAPSRGEDLGWYGLVREALSDQDQIQVLETGSRPESGLDTPAPPLSPPAVDPQLSRPMAAPPAWVEIAPSRLSQGEGFGPGDPDGRLRGQGIHRFLELFTRQPPLPEQDVQQLVARDTGLTPDDPELVQWQQEARNTLSSPELQHLFAERAGQRAYSEVPVQYREGKAVVYGVIDRLLVDDTDVWVVDYKTHDTRDPGSLNSLCDHYQPQLARYGEAVRRLWPGRTVHTCLLFTAAGTLIEINT